MNYMPPLVLVEINNPDGLDDPVVTKEERVTVVTLDWAATPPVRDVADAIRCLTEYKGMHPRIDKTLDRLRAAGGFGRVSSEAIARAFHDHYEALAPAFGWRTQEASRTSWEELPTRQRRLMVAVVEASLETGVIRPGPHPEGQRASLQSGGRR